MTEFDRIKQKLSLKKFLELADDDYLRETVCPNACCSDHDGDCDICYWSWFNQKVDEVPSLSDETIKSLTDFQDLMRILKKADASHHYVILTPVDIVNLYDGITYLLDKLIEKQNESEEIKNG